MDGTRYPDGTNLPKYGTLSKANLDDEDVRLCYLLKTGLPNKQIGVLLNLSSTALSKRKSRLHKKLTNEKESAKALVYFLMTCLSTLVEKSNTDYLSLSTFVK
jgi:DNA-binding NarL/FixJ family response regulator